MLSLVNTYFYLSNCKLMKPHLMNPTNALFWYSVNNDTIRNSTLNTNLLEKKNERDSFLRCMLTENKSVLTSIKDLIARGGVTTA